MANTVTKANFLLAVVCTTIICVQGSSRYARSKSDNTCHDELWGGRPCQSPGSGGSSKALRPECDYCVEERLLCKPLCDENGLTVQCPDGCCRDAQNCWDVNECDGAHGCPALSKCVNIAGGYECECNDGYALNVGETACVDIDECTDEPSICGLNAICSNSPPGRFACVCNDGYKLDVNGVCIDINECSDFPYICGLYARCSNSPSGGYTCVCNEGYGPDSNGVCIDVNECDGVHGCPAFSKCINIAGSYECECNDGYEMNVWEIACVDIDECTDDPSICGSYAICYNSPPGRFTCVCNYGYELDSYGVCIGINECSRYPGLCTAFGTCSDTTPGYSCTCLPGYEMDSGVCNPICNTACLNGGTCVAPDTCVCTSCFSGAQCELLAVVTAAGNPVGIGLVNGGFTISNSQITASSYWTNAAGYQARLHTVSNWFPRQSDLNQFLQVDFLTPTYMTGIQTQGSYAGDFWVTFFKVQTGDIPSSLTFIMENGVQKTFAGNTNRNDIVTNLFPSHIYSRYIRIKPTEWYDGIGLRIEILGGSGCTTSS